MTTKLSFLYLEIEIYVTFEKIFFTIEEKILSL
jgi:hypothetical protein